MCRLLFLCRFRSAKVRTFFETAEKLFPRRHMQAVRRAQTRTPRPSFSAFVIAIFFLCHIKKTLYLCTRKPRVADCHTVCRLQSGAIQKALFSYSGSPSPTVYTRVKWMAPLFSSCKHTASGPREDHPASLSGGLRTSSPKTSATIEEERKKRIPFTR